MKEELYRLELILKVNLLANVKDKLKIDLMDPMLKWEERMELFESIQWINKRIDLLNQRLLKKYGCQRATPALTLKDNLFDQIIFSNLTQRASAKTVEKKEL